MRFKARYFEHKIHHFEYNISDVLIQEQEEDVVADEICADVTAGAGARASQRDGTHSPSVATPEVKISATHSMDRGGRRQGEGHAIDDY